MENDKNVNKEIPETQTGFIRMKRFHFVMLLFFVVFLSAGITTFALAFGDEKAVTVANERTEFDKLYSAYDTLKGTYFQKVDEGKLIDGAINGMVDALDDPYSDYMDMKEAKSFDDTISSSFNGIGAEIQEQDGYIMVISPIKDSPAEKAGLKPNDKILTVDGKSIQGMSANKAVLLIRGDKGTTVKLSIQRPGVEENMDVSIVRDTIPIETVYGEMLEDGIAKVQITSFSTNTTKELVAKLNELQDQGMKGLILDLRQNPGGLLDEAIKISSLFLPDKEVILQVEDRNGKRQSITSTSTKENPNVPLVVVIDKGSASASEILAAAVHESAHVTLVGEKSFGKGTVQQAKKFTDGSNLKLTTEKWLTPDGNWIHKKGITPDVEVTLPPYAFLSMIDTETELKLSTTSTQVKTAQQMLKALGYDPGREDGLFDEKTEQAVKEFQAKENLEVNGIVSGQTTITLMQRIGDLITQNDTQIQKAVEILKGKM
ncbi:lmo1851 family serine protease [Bacillus benzoevorans]|uniref:Carboxyl-terminal processing protease n=2 Tax=Bacillus benzoevorans TaxID=1456 RepID=A0A7X0LWD0_9BACI|nr:carboxyl-terminal processing protease [Bacillus benzoevorans]